jgi:hypothetical protein
MTDDEIFTAATGQGLVVSTGILGDLVLPAGTFDPGHADEIRELAAQAAVYATQARGPGTLRAYRSAWRTMPGASASACRPFPPIPVWSACT